MTLPEALRAATLPPVATAEEIQSSLDRFLARWSNAAASERANAQLFLAELTDLLGVPRPGNDHGEGYSFEFPVRIPTDNEVELETISPEAKAAHIGEGWIFLDVIKLLGTVRVLDILGI